MFCITISATTTETGRLLDQSSYNPTSHKATTIQTLTRRAQLVCDSTDSLTDETNYLNNAPANPGVQAWLPNDDEKEKRWRSVRRCAHVGPQRIMGVIFTARKRNGGRTVLKC